MKTYNTELSKSKKYQWRGVAIHRKIKNSDVCETSEFFCITPRLELAAFQWM